MLGVVNGVFRMTVNQQTRVAHLYPPWYILKRQGRPVSYDVSEAGVKLREKR